jgi:hypothetical protein
MSIPNQTIVSFTEEVKCEAGRFCFSKGITGRISGTESGYFVIDANLGYPVYAPFEHLVIVATPQEIPTPESA